MSGIYAVWRREGSGPVGTTLSAMADGLCLHRGETISRLADDSAGIGLNARFETQQIFENPRVFLACDTDLVNEAELRKLTGDSTSKPTAALLAALYERLGSDFIQKLQGAFSLVIWDRRERRLIAAIDGFGIHRLVYCEDGKRLLVATRVDSIARSGQIETTINPQAIANVLNYSSNLAPETILKQVHRLQPGMMLIAENRHVRLKRYWDMSYTHRTGASEAELSRQLESLVEASVRTSCKDEVFSSVGAYLSGGTDSSTVLGMLSRLEKGQAKSFSIGFVEQQFNELEYAEIAAKRFRSDHHTYLVGAKDCFDALPDMIRSFDEPYGNSSAIPTYFCARLAAQNNVKVLLAGDGGDELFGGNTRYLTDKLFHQYQGVPRIIRKALIEPVVNHMPGSLAGKAQRYIQRSNLQRLERYYSYNFLRANPPEGVFQKDFLAALGNYSVLDIPQGYFEQAQASEGLDRLLYVDMKVTLADNDLPKVTCMSELAGIRTRFPFLDRSVAEFSGTIPANLKVKGFEKRYLFKHAFRNLLPIEIIQKKKHGFGIPVAYWMKSDPKMKELTYDVLRSSRSLERGYLRPEFVEDLFRKHEAEDTTYYGDTLWTLLSLELWHRQAVDEATKATA